MDMTPSPELLRLQAENERLKRIAADAREKLDAAMDGTGLCVWQLDIITGKLIIFNRRWGSMLGFQPKELEANFEVWKALHPAYKKTAKAVCCSWHACLEASVYLAVSSAISQLSASLRPSLVLAIRYFFYGHRHTAAYCYVLYHEHRAPGCAGHSMRHTAQQHAVLIAVSAASANHYQVGCFFVSKSHYDL